jgi:hypothetical protein
MNQLRLRQAVQEEASFAFDVEENAMRSYAEATWGRWLPAEDRTGWLSSFDPKQHYVIEAGGTDVGVAAVEPARVKLLVA